MLHLSMHPKLRAKNIAPLVEKISSLRAWETSVSFEDALKIEFSQSLSLEEKDLILQTALALKPWRKGPFCIGELLIDSEWQSFKKYNLIAPHLNIQDKDIADVGCNNGYYLLKMIPLSPKTMVGFDPSALFRCQFEFINHFIKSSIVFEMLGVEDLLEYPKKFDFILCMGVLYHRNNPIEMLKSLYHALNPCGEVILDTLILDTPQDLALCPPKSYAKMSNVYFIPSVSALQGWCERVGFSEVECFAKVKTDCLEQRKTQWIDSMSLENFLNPYDPNQTIEGYQAPLRGYFKLKRKK